MNMSDTIEHGKRRTTAGVWIGRSMSGLVVAFLVLVSAFPKVFLPGIAEEAMQRLGWNPKYLILIAVIEVTGALLYAFPRTAMLGAVLLTGLFGGAIATHLRIDDPWLSHTLFPVWLGLLMWGGLWLRCEPLRKLMPVVARLTLQAERRRFHPAKGGA